MKRLTVVLTLCVFLFGACQPVSVKEVSVKDLTSHKADYVSPSKSYIFTHGVVVFLSEKEDFFVITGDETLSPDDFGEDDYIIVKQSTKNIDIGDILDIYGVVHRKSVNADGENIEVQFLIPILKNDAVKKTGQVDVTDPDFEMLIEGIRNDVRNQNITFIIIWLVFFNPASPLSPMNPSFSH